MKVLLAVYSPVSRLVCRVKRELHKLGFGPAVRPPLPVLSVGNLAFGGSEKTPLAMALLQFLESLGRRPALVSRGYRGQWEKRGGILSDGRKILGTWREGGDEPYLAALRYPRAGVFVGKNRAASCRRAFAAGFDVAVLDDGFQHLRLHRNLDIVLLDPERRTPLREGRSALRSADIVLMRSENAPDAALPETPNPRTAVFRYAVAADGVVPLRGGPRRSFASLSDRRVLAFCGIARPNRFFGLLAENGVPPAARLSFPDHFDYPDRALDEIEAAARAAGCSVILTTEKDAVKVSGRLENRAGLDVLAASIRLVLPGGFFEAIQAALARNSDGREK